MRAWMFLGWCWVGSMPLGAVDPPRLTHGPLLGFPEEGEIAVWARTSRPGTFEVRYGLAPGALERRSEPVTTRLEHDNTGVARLTELEADRLHHYQAFIDGFPHGLPGSFRTLPDGEAMRNEAHNPEGLFNFRFEVGSCANQRPGHGVGHRAPAYETLNRDWAERVHFHIMNGDWLYEEERDFPLEAWRLTQRVESVPRVLEVAPSLVGVWENYKLYLSRGVSLAEWHRRVPSWFTFDDHELLNDIWGAGSPGRRHRRAVFRDIGTRAWFDYLGWANPVEYEQPVHFGRARMEAGSARLVDESADFTALPLEEMINLHVHWGTTDAGVNEMALDERPGDPNAAIYEIERVIDEHTLELQMPARASGEVSYSIGRRSYGRRRVANCEFFLLDTRGGREMHDIRERDKPGLSMLGRAQREWLLESMRASDADFFFVVSSVPFMIPHSGAGGVEVDAANKEEAWTGFYDEREKLIAAWEELDKPVFVMTGDLHNSFAVKISERIWEFCCGPHNSVNHVPANDEGGRPATGIFQSGPRSCDIRWSTYPLPDLPRSERLYPHFCIVQVNNVFNMPREFGGERWVAYPHPQVVFQYYDGRSGELRYAEAVSVGR